MVGGLPWQELCVGNVSIHLELYRSSPFHMLLFFYMLVLEKDNSSTARAISSGPWPHPAAYLSQAGY